MTQPMPYIPPAFFEAMAALAHDAIEAATAAVKKLADHLLDLRAALGLEALDEALEVPPPLVSRPNSRASWTWLARRHAQRPATSWPRAQRPATLACRCRRGRP